MPFNICISTIEVSHVIQKCILNELHSLKRTKILLTDNICHRTLDNDRIALIIWEAKEVYSHSKPNEQMSTTKKTVTSPTPTYHQLNLTQLQLDSSQLILLIAMDATNTMRMMRMVDNDGVQGYVRNIS